MNRQKFVARFYFEKNRVLDDDIGSISALEADAFINQMQFDLPFQIADPPATVQGQDNPRKDAQKAQDRLHDES